MRRVATLLFGAAGLALLPWTIWLSSSLPPHHRSRNWDIAWPGFDSALALCFLATAYAAWRRRPWLPPAASATGALLVADAWFDIVLESRSDDLRLAIIEAVVAELPLAAACFGVAWVTSHAGRKEPGQA